MRLNIFPNRQKIYDPEVVFPTTNRLGRIDYGTRILHGRFVRVIPETIREVHALQMLDHLQDKFAPAKGDGVILSAEALAKLDA